MAGSGEAEWILTRIILPFVIFVAVCILLIGILIGYAIR